MSVYLKCQTLKKNKNKTRYQIPCATHHLSAKTSHSPRRLGRRKERKKKNYPFQYPYVRPQHKNVTEHKTIYSTEPRPGSADGFIQCLTNGRPRPLNSFIFPETSRARQTKQSCARQRPAGSIRRATTVIESDLSRLPAPTVSRNILQMLRSVASAK